MFNVQVSFLLYNKKKYFFKNFNNKTHFLLNIVNTISLSQITREFWDLIFSLRFFDDPAVLSSLLFGISAILNVLSERELAESFGKELVESQQWVTSRLILNLLIITIGLININNNFVKNFF